MSKSQKQSAINPGKPKSNRGRKPGNMSTTWYVRLKGILECNLKGKPRKIYEEFNMSYGGLYPKDLPMKQIQMNQMIPRLNRLSKGSKGTLSRK